MPDRTISVYYSFLLFGPTAHEGASLLELPPNRILRCDPDTQVVYLTREEAEALMAAGWVLQLPEQGLPQKP